MNARIEWNLLLKVGPVSAHMDPPERHRYSRTGLMGQVGSMVAEWSVMLLRILRFEGRTIRLGVIFTVQISTLEISES